MASTTAICTSFKQELMVAEHDFTNSTGDTWQWALYTSTATNGAGSTNYITGNEVANGNGYTTGGDVTAATTPTTGGTTAYVDFEDPTWTSASFTAASTMLYNQTHASDASVAVWDFGGDQTASGGDFVLQLPTADQTNAILRLA